MKRLMTVTFAAMIAIVLSAPAWAQSKPANQTKPAASVSKTEKKQAKAKARAEKKAAKKNATKKNTANKK